MLNRTKTFIYTQNKIKELENKIKELERMINILLDTKRNIYYIPQVPTIPEVPNIPYYPQWYCNTTITDNTVK